MQVLEGKKMETSNEQSIGGMGFKCVISVELLPFSNEVYQNGQTVIELASSKPEPLKLAHSKNQESSSADASGGKPSVEKEPVKDGQSSKSNNGGKTAMISGAQKNCLLSLSRRHKISIEDLEGMAMKDFNLTLDKLTSRNASTLIQKLQKAS